MFCEYYRPTSACAVRPEGKLFAICNFFCIPKGRSIYGSSRCSDKIDSMASKLCDDILGI